MRLTTFSDYAIRVLMFAAAAGERLVTVEETAKAYGISRAHLMKVVNILTREGYLTGRFYAGMAGGSPSAAAPTFSAAGQQRRRDNLHRQRRLFACL